MFHQSIDNYLELCKQIGKKPEKEFRGSFNVRISPELHRKAALEAEKQKITLNQYVLRAIEKSFVGN
ncbi:MAG: type II toxin-antitoxin system HicB family antitoxin [Lachnospiraceae bacterium]|nr:type II toxin-antitoxin system HicB family antitoxin [Lachnospiraceae bacterium]